MKFLGVVIDSELNWEKHVAAVRKKCFVGLATLSRLRNTLPVNLKSGLFNALIRPHLDYTAQLSGRSAVKFNRERSSRYKTIVCDKPCRCHHEPLVNLSNEYWDGTNLLNGDQCYDYS